MTRGKRNSKGFSLIELLVAVAILTLVMGVVFQQIDRVQKARRVEDQKVDLTQEAREFMDQFVRDVHQAGSPSVNQFSTGALTSPPENDSHVAVGLVKYAPNEVWLEADLNGDGVVESINYKLQPSGSNCPCTIARSQVPKINGTAPTSQTISYSIELSNIINSGGANGSASGTSGYSLTGTTGFSNQSINTVYAAYKNANVFTAYDAAGTEVAAADYSTTAGRNTLKTIKTIKINVNLLANRSDLQTGMRPVVTLAGSGRVANN